MRTDMPIEKRYLVEGPGPREAHPTKAAATKAAAKRDKQDRLSTDQLEAGAGYRVRGPVRFETRRFGVASGRDGELAIRGVPEQTAHDEARRLTLEQAERRASEPLNTGMLDDEHRRDVGADLHPTTYTVVEMPDVELTAQEA